MSNTPSNNTTTKCQSTGNQSKFTWNQLFSVYLCNQLTTSYYITYLLTSACYSGDCTYFSVVGYYRHCRNSASMVSLAIIIHLVYFYPLHTLVDTAGVSLLSRVVINSSKLCPLIVQRVCSVLNCEYDGISANSRWRTCNTMWKLRRGWRLSTNS